MIWFPIQNMHSVWLHFNGLWLTECYSFRIIHRSLAQRRTEKIITHKKKSLKGFWPENRIILRAKWILRKDTLNWWSALASKIDWRRLKNLPTIFKRFSSSFFVVVNSVFSSNFCSCFSFCSEDRCPFRHLMHFDSFELCCGRFVTHSCATCA